MAPRFVSDSVFPGLHSCDDGDESADRLALCEHQESSTGAADARHIHWLACRAQPTCCDSPARSDVVRNVRKYSVGCCSPPCAQEWCSLKAGARRIHSP